MSIIATFIVPHPPLIVPNIGKGEELKIQKTIDAYHKIAKEIAKIKPSTIIISSPHAQLYADYFHISPNAYGEGNLKKFGAPELKFKVDYDEFTIGLISDEAEYQGIPAGIDGDLSPTLDHGTTVPLFFINQYYKGYKVIRMSPSGLSPLDHYKYGKLIQSVISKEKKVVWVASGDLSHKLLKDGPYGLSEEGPLFDKELTDALAKGDFLKLLNFDPYFVSKAAECGLNSFIMMAGALDGYQVKSELLSYEGPFGVGYAVAKFSVLQKDDSRMFDKLYESLEFDSIKAKRELEDPYVKLARESLEHFIINKAKLSTPKNLIEDLINNKAGVFVSIHKHNKLRGCIGTINPTKKSIADEIIQNAISAGTSDPRFQPIKRKELPHLEYSVDVLFPAEAIESINELDVKRYGVIVYNKFKTGLLLPNLDGIDTALEQVSIAKRKAGIKDDEQFDMKRFEVIRHY